METNILRIGSNLCGQELMNTIAPVASALRRGALVAFPTETVYGLGCNPFDEIAVQRLFNVKGRLYSKPLILLVGSIEEAWSLSAEVPEIAIKLANRFWPGPLTLVLTQGKNVPDSVCGGTGTVSVRLSPHRITLALVHKFGGPVTAPSANLSGAPTAQTVDDVKAQLDGKIDWIIDERSTERSATSTILNLTGNHPTLLRSGCISTEELETVLGQTISNAKLKPAG